MLVCLPNGQQSSIRQTEEIVYEQLRFGLQW